MNRTKILQLELSDFAKLCTFSTCRGVGPGGQKRNKTSSAVHAVMAPLGVASFDDTTRSQHQNKMLALKKLRIEIALKIREEHPAPWAGAIPGIHSEQFTNWLAIVFDFLNSLDYKVSDAAKALNCSTNQLCKNLGKYPAAWQFLNQERQKRNLPILRLT